MRIKVILINLRLEEISDLNKISDHEERKLFPGQSGRIGGFKELPDAGFPLYKVNDPLEAKFLTSVRLKRKDIEESKKRGIQVFDKKIINVDWREKRRLYSGDTMGIMTQLDIIDDKDIETMKKQLEKEERDAENMSRFRKHKVWKRKLRTERLKEMLAKQDENYIAEEEKDEDELIYIKEQQQIFANILKSDDQVHQPIILKAPSSGALETVLKEVNKSITR